MTVSSQEIQDLLAKTLVDFRVSRNEKYALQELLKKIGGDAAGLAAFRQGAFAAAKQAQKTPEGADTLDWLAEVLRLAEQPAAAAPSALATPTSGAAPAAGAAAVVSEAYFSPGDNCVNAISRLFRAAKKRVDVCVFTITDDRVTREILDAKRRGVAVRIITDNDKAFDRGSDIPDLEKAGVPVRVDKTEFHMHHKYAIFDGALLLTGSYNWTRGAAMDNQENFIVINDAKLLKEFVDHFEKLWNSLA